MKKFLKEVDTTYDATHKATVIVTAIAHNDADIVTRNTTDNATLNDIFNVTLDANNSAIFNVIHNATYIIINSVIDDLLEEVK